MTWRLNKQGQDSLFLCGVQSLFLISRMSETTSISKCYCINIAGNTQVGCRKQIKNSIAIESSLVELQVKAGLMVGQAERPRSSFQHTWCMLLDADMLMLSMMECSHSVCRDSIVVPSPCPSRCAVWWAWKNIICTTCFRNILPWDPNFQFLQGDLRVLLPVAASYSHLAVSCQLDWLSPNVLQPTAHHAPASAPFPFPRVLVCSPDNTSLGSTLCICVARLISAFYRYVIHSDAFYQSSWKDLGCFILQC